MKSYRTLALKELLSQKVTSILILIAVVLSTMMTTIVGKGGRSGPRRSAGVPHLSGVRGRELYRISAWRVSSFSAGGARSLFR